VKTLKVTASAPAKLILFGEHFVVYGEPAIACAIDLRVKVKAEERDDGLIYVESSDFDAECIFPQHNNGIESEAYRILKPIYIAAEKTLEALDVETGLKIEIDSQIPVAAGLGSSAAVAAATVKAVSTLLGETLSLKDICLIATEAERTVHSNPSGIDPTISTYGGVIIYSKKRGIEKLKVGCGLNIIVCDTGIKRSTGDQVNLVGEIAREYPKVFDSMLKAAREIVLTASREIELGNLTSLGKLMNLNHGLLSAIGVSCLELDELVHTARKAGALGAKLTGAGGGGCMIALSTPEKLEAIAEALRSIGGKIYTTEITYEGVRVE